MPSPAAPPPSAPPTPVVAPASTPAPASPTPTAPLAPDYKPPTTPGDRQFTPGKFDDLDTLGDDAPPSGIPAPAPSTPPVPKGPEPKPGEPAKPAAPSEPEVDTDGVPKSALKTNRELRQWAVGQSKKAKELQSKADQLETKIKELEAKTGTIPQTEDMAKQLTEMENKVKEYETKLRYVNYQQSSEYREKYEQPINTAIEKAHKFVEELRVEEVDAESGEVTHRPATAQDFNRIYHLDRADARALAKTMFGDDANEVMQHRSNIRDLSEQAGKAIEDYKKKGQEIETQRTVKSTQEREQTARLWRKVNDELGTKFPKWFKPIEGDDEGNKALENGYALVDSALGENRAKMTVQERILADAHIRNRAAGFARQVLINKRLTTALEEAAKTIEKLRGSSPGGKPDAGRGQQPEKKHKTWEEEMDERFPE